MPVVIAEAAAPMASWRPPEALTYQPTLPLPPYTTQVGVLGAALGLALPDAYQFVAGNHLRLGVGGWHGGKARDLWKHQKLKDKGVESDILLREQWIDTRLVFVVEAPAAATAERVAGAFARPAFPLTAGPSDALIVILAVRVSDMAPVDTHLLHRTMAYREISPRYTLYEDIRAMPLSRSVQAPTVENLPTGFEFDAAGNRRRAGRARVTFIADPIELADDPVVGYRVAPASRLLRADSSRWGIDEWTIPVHRYD